MKALLLGDLSPTKATAPLFSRKEIGALFGDTVSLFSGNDINFVNLECALTDAEKEIKKFGPALKAPIETAEVMKAVGINYCGLSNNHIFDYGIKGATDTMRALEKAQIAYTGFGENEVDARKNLVITKGAERVCIIAVCEHEYSYALENRMGSRPYDAYDTIGDIRAAKQENDRVIVIYHGGKEQCRYPSPRLRKLCRAMAKNGADVVLCQHSHCIGCYETYEGCHILYGQGNFHFVRFSDAEGWDSCLAVSYDTQTHQIAFTPLQMGEIGVNLARGENAEKLMTAFEQRNQELASGGWRRGWQRFCEEKKALYMSVIENTGREASAENNGMFGHYLDCEAHTDVWRELFPSYNLTNEMQE